MQKEINILATYQNTIGTKLSYLAALCKGYWSHTGHFSLTNLHRWVFGPGTGLRSIERFFASAQDWGLNSAELIGGFLSRLSGPFTGLLGEWALATDETVGKKAGHATHGIGFHYSSKDDKVIKSVAVLNLSLLQVGTKLSLPVCHEQLLFNTVKRSSPAKSGTKKQAVEALGTAPSSVGGKGPRKAGRPKGSKNKPKEAVELAYTFRVLERILGSFFKLFAQYLSKFIQIKYLVGDGGFGNNTTAKIARGQALHLISKLQYNAALYFPFEGEYSGKGRPSVYGLKIDYNNLPQSAVTQQHTLDGATYTVYHLKKMLHKSFDMPLNVVVLVKQSGSGKKPRPIVLFSTDLEASPDTIVKHYHARFQIEFNFRDARQFFGLSHFKNIKPTQVANTIGYAFFMVSLSNIILFEIKAKHPECQLSIQDLKAFFRAEKYLHELLNTPELNNNAFLSHHLQLKIPIVGAINIP